MTLAGHSARVWAPGSSWGGGEFPDLGAEEHVRKRHLEVVVWAGWAPEVRVRRNGDLSSGSGEAMQAIFQLQAPFVPRGPCGVVPALPTGGTLAAVPPGALPTPLSLAQGPLASLCDSPVALDTHCVTPLLPCAPT